jgi:alpha/beta superfamily hydrolase
VHGARDELVDAAVVRRWVAEFDDPPQLVELPDAEHFFHGELGELRAGVRRFLESLVPQGGNAADRGVP